MRPTTRTSEPAPARRWPPPTGLALGLAGARGQPWSRDLVAGAVVAAMLVPQGMAYAALAGVPIQAGLYAPIASLLVYGLLGPSRALSVGPVAIDSLLTAHGLAGLAILGTALAQEHAALLAMLVAGTYLVAWALRLGALAALLSAPVLLGFTHAAALVIAFSQVRHLARLPVGGEGRPYEVIAATLGSAKQAHLPTLAVGGLALALLVAWRRWGSALLGRLGLAPGPAQAGARAAPLLAVIVGALLVAGLGLEGRGVRVVGEVPQGLPAVGWPAPGALGPLALDLLPTALVIAGIGFLECLSIARTLAARRGERVLPDAELFALGLSNAASGFVGGFPVTGGLSRSMVNHQAGAASGRASLVTSALLLLSVLALAPWFHPIPQAALAAIVVVAVATLLDLQAFRALWRARRADAAVALGTFAAVLLAGVELGMLLGLVLGLLAAGARRWARRSAAPPPRRAGRAS